MCRGTPELSEDDIRNVVHAKLEAYEGKNLLERFAIYMGKVQILEFGLKNLLSRLHEVPIDVMERWTLGRTKTELENRGFRPDFIQFLNGVVRRRNYIAHELLLDNAITNSISNFSPRRLEGELFRATYELEQIIVLYDWCEENNGWT